MKLREGNVQLNCRTCLPTCKRIETCEHGATGWAIACEMEESAAAEVRGMREFFETFEIFHRFIEEVRAQLANMEVLDNNFQEATPPNSRIGIFSVDFLRYSRGCNSTKN